MPPGRPLPSANRELAVDWLPIALLSALSLATADALTKRYLGDWGARDLLLVRFGLGGLLLLPMLAIQPLPALQGAQWGWLALLVPLELVAMHLYVTAIRDAPLSDTLPYLSFTPIFTAILGYFLLDESIGPRGLAGIVLVVSGAYLLNLPHAYRPTSRRARSGRLGGGLAPLAPLRAMLTQRGARLMLVVASLYGVTSVGSKAAMGEVPAQSFGAFYFVLIGIFTLLVYRGWTPATARRLARRPVAVAAVAAAMAAMVVLHFVAIAKVEAAYMVSVKRFSLLFGIVYGAWWFQEPGLLKNLSAGLLMVTGVALVMV